MRRRLPVIRGLTLPESHVLTSVYCGRTLKQIASGLGVPRGKVDLMTWKIRKKMGGLKQVEEFEEKIWANRAKFMQRSRKRRPKVMQRFTAEMAAGFIPLAQNAIRGTDIGILSQLKGKCRVAARTKDAISAVSGLQVNPEQKIGIIEAISEKAKLSIQEKAALYGKALEGTFEGMAKIFSINESDVITILNSARKKLSNAGIHTGNIRTFSR